MSKGNFLRKIKQLVKGGADSSIFCSMKESDKDIIFRFEEEASLNNASIEIKHRKSGKTFEGKIENNTASVPLNELWNLSDRGVFDIFVKASPENRIRVRFKDENQDFKLVLEEKFKVFTAYSTIEDNLSLKLRRIDQSFNYIIDSFDLKDGRFLIDGTFLSSGNDLDTIDINPKFYLETLNRDNKKTILSEVISEHTEFSLDELLEIKNYGIYDFYFVTECGEYINKKRVEFNLNKLHSKEYLNYENSSIELYSNVNNNLSMKIDFNYIIENLELSDGNLIVTGSFLDNLGAKFNYEDIKGNLPKFFMEIRHRKTGQRIEREILTKKTMFPVNELFEISTEENFDFYFKIRTKHTNSKKRITGEEDVGNLKVVSDKNILHSYFTVYGNLSLMIDESMFDYDFDEIKVYENDKVFIRGNLSILDKEINGINKLTILSKTRLEGEEKIYDFKITPLNENKVEFEGIIDEIRPNEEIINMRSDFYIRLYDEDGIYYQELVDLKNYKAFKSDEKRFLLQIRYKENVYSYYATEGKNTLALWITTEGSFEKSYTIAKGRGIFNKFSNQPMDENMIFFESFFGKSYSGNPKYLYEKMLEMGMDKDYKFVWTYSGENKDIIPGNPIIVDRNEAGDYYKYLALSKYWINNIIFPVHNKRGGNVYLQTWHGTPLKKLGFDITIPGPEVEGRENFYKESRNWDYLISSNTYSTTIFKRAFKFNKEVLELGYPINDIFFEDNTEFVNSLKAKLNIDKDKKIILYAPTWKDDEKKESWKHYFNLEIDLESLYNEFKDEYVILLKMHHLISEDLVIDEKMKDFAIDLSDYDDVQELYILADILITDYSSVFFDYAHSRRPILFFVPDLEHYIENVRGLYLDMKTDLPGPLVMDNAQLIDTIKNIDTVMDDYKEKYELFYNRFCSLCDGHSSEEIIKKVFENLENLE